MNNSVSILVGNLVAYFRLWVLLTFTAWGFLYIHKVLTSINVKHYYYLALNNNKQGTNLKKYVYLSKSYKDICIVIQIYAIKLNKLMTSHTGEDFLNLET